MAKRLKTLTITNPDSGASTKYEIEDAAVGVAVYSTSKPYYVGDLCIYNNTLYECIDDVTAGSAFDSTKWSSTSIGSKIQSLQAQVNSLIQQSAFEIVVEDNEYILYWHGVESECPYSITLENGEYVLNYEYDSAS